MRIGRKGAKAFLLVEVMLGVAIFAIGVLALGKCVNNCVQAEIAQKEDRIARIALANRLALIEGGAIDTGKAVSEEPLKGMFAGITLKQRIKPVSIKDENKQEIGGMSELTLDAVWKIGNEEQVKSLSIYVQRP